MKTRTEEVEELIAETKRKINGWLWTNHFSKEPPTAEIRELIEERIRLEIELHDLKRL